jgi:hypothetical protein
MFKINSGYKILSPSGFVNFSGIQKVYKPFYHHIIFDDNTEIKCSNNHPFGKEKIVYNEIVEEGIWLYDPINVDKGNLYYANNIISHNCDFLGSADTLISPSKLQTIPFADPIASNAGLDVYERVQKDHEYIITVDVARGIGGDYSAFIVFDITTMPYRIVAKYRNNEIKPVLFPSVIFQVCKEYNNPYVLVEVNDIGDSIAATLNYDLEYPNVLMCAMRGRAGQIVGQGFSGNKTQLGVKMSVTVKKIGCANLKAIIEEDKLIFNDFQIFQELTTFVQKKQAWEADEGYHDDLVMCMVLFAWLVMQEYFKEMTDQDVRRRIYEEQRNQIEQDMAPFGFIDDGMGDDTFIDADGSLWEYGNTQEEVSYMWNY